MPTTAVDDHTSHTMTCMEIWGGNRAVETGVSVPGVDAWVYSQPYGGDLTGGDLHYVSVCGAGRISRFVVADVAGHGRAVGQLAAALRTLMRKHISKVDQTRFIQSLNREFSILADGEVFATALLTTYYALTDQLIICNAGHPAPLWYSAKDRTWRPLFYEMPERVDTATNLPLGVIDPTIYHQFAVQLGRGDLVLLYTDSIPETQDPAGSQLGREGLLDQVRKLDADRPETLCRSLLDRLDAYRQGGEPEDDVTLLLLHHNAADPPKQSLGDRVTLMGKMLGLIRI